MPNDDEKIWQAYTKGVKPVAKTSAKKSVSFRKTFSSTGEAGRKKIDPESHLVFSNQTTKGIPGSAAARKPRNDTVLKSVILDRSLEKKLRAGDVLLDGRIDLHGMTQAEAHAALASFIARQVKAGRRTLLVIAGKGKDNKGVLKTNFPAWLESLPEAGRILGIYKAAIKHGGDGAFYVLLRRKKD